MTAILQPINNCFCHRGRFLSIGRSCLLVLGLSLTGCADIQEKSDAIPTVPATSKPGKPAKSDQLALPGVGSYQAEAVTGDYARYPALQKFIAYMQQKHQFKPEYLYGLFSQAKRKQWTLDYLAKSDQTLKSPPAKGGWTRYRSQFLDEAHIASGVAFWQKNHSALQRAEQQYGVPPEYILGILGVETGFGVNVGKHRIIDALTTLSFDYARRGEYFQSELENFLVMSRDEQIDPGKPVGSFAGAMGLGQFMPSSFLQWAVDFNADQRRDLWSAEDAIGSVANYFAKHGWQAGQAVVSAARGTYQEGAGLPVGIEPTYTLASLKQAGIEPKAACDCDGALRLLLLRHQNRDEYLLGHANFYVITRYNHSTYYAMAVHDLAQAIKSAYLHNRAS